MSAIIKEYATKLDDKRRFTLRGSKFNYYNVKEFDDGHIELEPKVLVSPKEISKNTLKMMDKSITNYKKHKVSPKINLKNK
jgi:hypothetical protein